MTPQEFEKLPILESDRTIGNDLTGYTDLQLSLLPYIEHYHLFLWVLFFSTAAFLIFRFIAKPLFSGEKQQIEASETPPAINAPAFIQNIYKFYWKFFRLHEIHNDVIVRLFGAAVLLGFLASFRGWESGSATTYWAAASGRALCWPVFQQCTDLHLMNARPYGYTQNVIFMAMLGFIFTAAYSLFTKRTALAHACMLILLIWKAYIVSINYSYNANYDYYQTSFAVIFLFLPYKRFFGSLSVVLFYFLSTATKIHESWSLGTYFTSMQTG